MPGGPGWSGGREDYHKRGSECNRGSEGLARQSIDDLCLLLSSPRLICLSLSLSFSVRLSMVVLYAFSSPHWFVFSCVRELPQLFLTL